MKLKMRTLGSITALLSGFGLELRHSGPAAAQRCGTGSCAAGFVLYLACVTHLA